MFHEEPLIRIKTLLSIHNNLCDARYLPDVLPPTGLANRLERIQAMIMKEIEPQPEPSHDIDRTVNTNRF